jgi:hypothetical protein
MKKKIRPPSARSKRRDRNENLRASFHRVTCHQNQTTRDKTTTLISVFMRLMACAGLWIALCGRVMSLYRTKVVLEAGTSALSYETPSYWNISLRLWALPHESHGRVP